MENDINYEIVIAFNEWTKEETDKVKKRKKPIPINNPGILISRLNAWIFELYSFSKGRNIPKSDAKARNRLDQLQNEGQFLL